MRVIVMGAGGVGGYFGARLAQGGCDVTFIARGEHLAALRKDGLRVESKLGDVHLAPVDATDDVSAARSADLILICVKLWDTETAARQIALAVAPDTAVVSLQNGVEKEEVLRRIVPQRALLGGVSYTSASILRPGVIAHAGGMQRLVFGEFDSSPSARCDAILSACRSGGIEADLSTDIRRAIWEKFVFLVGLSATTTAMRSSIGAIRTNQHARSLLLDLMRETLAVARAHGIPIADDFAEKRLAFCDGLPADMTSSMHTDLEHGRRLEVDWLSGSVVELGKAAGVATELNRAMRDVLSLAAAGRNTIS